MASKISAIAIILLATFTASDFTRIRWHKAEEGDELEKQLQIAVRNDERYEFEKHSQIAVENDDVGTNQSLVVDKAVEDRATHAADGAEALSAFAPVMTLEYPAAFVQEAVSQGSVFSPASNVISTQLGVVPNDAPSMPRPVQSARNPPTMFSKTLLYVKNANDYSCIPILKAACDSNAFTCAEIINFAYSSWGWLGPTSERWVNAVRLFAAGRNGEGCISDPANAKSIVDSFKSNWLAFREHPALMSRLGELEEAFIDNADLKPARNIEPLPMQFQTGLRTNQDMVELLLEMEGLQLIKAYGSQREASLHVPGSPSMEEFESWLKKVRARGEQFSGSQLVTLVDTIPRNAGSLQAVSVLLQYLEQHVAGVTCFEVRHITMRMVKSGGLFLAGLRALKSNIVDGQNKVDIVASTDMVYSAIVNRAERVLWDVGVGLPPKNNPIFGVVKGNPVIFVVDESTSMDANLTLGDETFTYRKFCHSQLEAVLKALPNGTYFNVVLHSSSAVKIFKQTVLISKTNIDAAMEALSRTLRSVYIPGQDPAKMLHHMQAFALDFKYRLNRSIKRSSMEALQLAYAVADWTSQQADDRRRQGIPHDYEQFLLTRDAPQIYFLTSGQPDCGARQILDNIDEFDNGRNIPVNSIAFSMAADSGVKQFVKDLANKTGGFFRSPMPLGPQTEERLMGSLRQGMRQWLP